jgi:hypothetical protein
MSINVPNVIERYYERFFAVDLAGRPGEDQYVYRHSNGLLVIGCVLFYYNKLFFFFCKNFSLFYNVFCSQEELTFFPPYFTLSPSRRWLNELEWHPGIRCWQRGVQLRAWTTM